MKKIFTLVLTLAAAPVCAEVARVRSGEHPEFTRVVVDADIPGDWRFGRTDDGYELQFGPAVTGYDLTEAFERIPRDRVSGLWRDPVTGRLHLALSCTCHAVAFEFRPGIVVIDIKSGPPPAGSSFEDPLDPPDPETVAEASADPLAAAGYDWIAAARDPDEAADLPLPMDIDDPVLASLRKTLLEQISRGVAEGVVGIAEHPDLPAPSPDATVAVPGLRIVNGDLPGVVAGTAHEPGPNLTATGAACITDTALAVGDWLPEGAVAELIGPGRAGLIGEFDQPDNAAILRAARLYIALGFGAEARQMLGLMVDPQTAEVALLAAMARVADLEPGGEAAFGGMGGCETAAALWWALTLSIRDDAQSSDVRALNTGAVTRAFSALPAHLRRHFGPSLVNLFLAAEDEETARRLRDAIRRAPENAGPAVDLMDAGFHLATGDEKEAAEIAARVARDAGTEGVEALVTLVEAAFRDGAALPADVPETLAAYRMDARGTPHEAARARAYMLALSMTGDFDRAFAVLPQAPDSVADLWLLAAAGAKDDLFLDRALAEEPPPVAAGVAQAIAGRLLDLGFAEAALAWLGPVGPADDTAHRLMAARATLMLHEARRALALISGLGGTEAETIRAAAVLQLGDAGAAATALDRAGDAAARDRALVWAGDWTKVATEGAAPWKAAATLVTGDATKDPATGPIAQATALAEASAGARGAVASLLAVTEPP
jgi:hypothetical protein